MYVVQEVERVNTKDEIVGVIYAHAADSGFKVIYFFNIRPDIQNISH